MIDNWHNKRNSVIENWHVNISRKDDREIKAIERPIAITYKDNKKDFDDRKGYSHVVQKMIEVEKEVEKENKNHELKDLFIEKKDNSHIEIVQDKLDVTDGDKEKGMERQQGNSTLTNSKETLRKKLDIEKDIEKEKDMMRKEEENDSLVNKGWKNDSSKRNDSLREKIDEKLKSIERSTIYT